MNYEIRCVRCDCPIDHVCNTDFKQAVMDFLTWVPQGGISSSHMEGEAREAMLRAAKDYGFEDVEIMPFFGSQSWSYLLFHKGEARTFHALINQILRGCGLNAHELSREAFEYVEKTHPEHRYERRRRMLSSICRLLRKETGESGNNTLVLREMEDTERLDTLIENALELGCDPDVLEMARASVVGKSTREITARFIHSANVEPEDDPNTKEMDEELEGGKKARFRSEIEDVCEKYGYVVEEVFAKG